MIRTGKTGTIRLTGDDLKRLRLACFERDLWRCGNCRRVVSILVSEKSPRRAHMAHILGRGAGGPDELGNVRTLCAQCHRAEHQPKVVPHRANA